MRSSMCGWLANHKALCKCKVVPLLLLALMSPPPKKKKSKEVGWRELLLPKQIYFSQDSFTLEPGAQELDLRE